MPTLDGRVAIVSGAARGLGAAFAGALAGRGASVLAFDVDPEVVNMAQSWSGRGDGRIVALEADVSSRQDVERVVARALEWGGIDVLVNNACPTPRRRSA